ILAWAMRGAMRLVKRRRFKPGPAHDALMAQWRRSTSSVIAFLQDEEACELERDDLVGNESFEMRRSRWYQEYADWCRLSGYRALGKKLAYEELNSTPAAALGVRIVRRADGWMVLGMRLSDQIGE